MTEEIKTMTEEQIDARIAEIRSAVENKTEGADFIAMSSELDELRARKQEIETARITAEEEQRKADLQAVIDGAGKQTEITPIQEDKTMHEEIRNSAEYIKAYAEYIKSGDDKECRALLTENVATGVVPVPQLVYDIIHNAWDNEGIMSRVKKSYLKGNLKVGFEVSADEAAIHTEGANAPTEEKLVLGIVELVPASIKKWITISDEVLDLAGEAFLRYVYDELTYQIAKKAAATLIAKIEACGTVSTNTATTNVAVPVISTASISLGLVASAIAQLSDKAANPVVMMNKQTFAAFKAVQYAGSYPVDPFEGCEVVFNNSIAAFSAATSGVTFAIVGDLGYGALANFPNGEEITIKYDDLSLAEKDLVKVVGREYVGLGVVAPNAFCKIAKPEE